MGGCVGKPPEAPKKKAAGKNKDVSKDLDDEFPDDELTSFGKSGGSKREAAGDGGSPPPHVEVQKLSVEEFKKAAAKFQKSNLVGQGPTGKVYKGTLNGQTVAVKTLTSNSLTEDDFLEEVELVSRFHNRHVVQLLAYCPVAGHRALAFEFAQLGSLFDRLHGKSGEPPPKALTWAQRLRILQGAAQGLEYLHFGLADTDGGLVHKRIKSANVLVFDGYEGKIADCKLQSQDQDSVIMDSSLPLGNFACEAPETFTGELTQKSDVYSFGVVLLEAISGRKTMQGITSGNPGSRPQSIKEWALGHIANQKFRAIVDPKIPANSIEDKALQRYCKLASICLEADPPGRPDMRLVVKYLLRID